MSDKRLILFLFVFSINIHLYAQNHYSRFESIDVQHYKFEIHLNDSTNQIEGIATISIKFLQAKNDITLDLVGNSDESGMLVHSVKMDGYGLDFIQGNNKLEIHLNEKVQTSDEVSLTINYSGIPADGLVISENKYGQRTFFWRQLARSGKKLAPMC